MRLVPNVQQARRLVPVMFAAVTGLASVSIALASVLTAGAPTRVPEWQPFAVWQDGRFSPTGNAKIALSMSTDGGLTWSAPIRVDQSVGNAPAFTPQVNVAADGTVGVVYYDLENATAAQHGLTDAFLVHCHTLCANSANWALGGETRVTTSGSFDMLQAPVAVGPFVGDYIGLAHSGSSFVPFFVAAKPLATTGLTDSFSNIVTK